MDSVRELVLSFERASTRNPSAKSSNRWNYRIKSWMEDAFRVKDTHNYLTYFVLVNDLQSKKGP